MWLPVRIVRLFGRSYRLVSRLADCDHFAIMISLRLGIYAQITSVHHMVLLYRGRSSEMLVAAALLEEIDSS